MLKKRVILLDEIGTDISHDWTFNSQGDLGIVSDEDNIVQTIMNKLNTFRGELDIYYLEYGSIMQSYLGWLSEEDTLDFMKIEMESILSEDARLTDYSVEMSLDGSDKVLIEISISFGNNSEVELSLTTTDDGEFVEA